MPKKKTKKTPPKDPDEIRSLLDAIDLDKHRARWKPQGVPVETVWNDFYETMLEGNAWNPEPNPLDYVNFDAAFRQWCSHYLKKYGPAKVRDVWHEDSGYPTAAQAQARVREDEDVEEAKIADQERIILTIEDEVLSWDDEKRDLFLDMMEAYAKAYCPQMLRGTSMEQYWRRWNALQVVYGDFVNAQGS